MFNMTPSAGCTLASTTVSVAGLAQPVNNMQPYLNMVYCMCVSNGYWPEKP
jgi:microcystin-dependent protein